MLLTLLTKKSEFKYKLFKWKGFLDIVKINLLNNSEIESAQANLGISSHFQILAVIVVALPRLIDEKRYVNKIKSQFYPKIIRDNFSAYYKAFNIVKPMKYFTTKNKHFKCYYNTPVNIFSYYYYTFICCFSY